MSKELNDSTDQLIEEIVEELREESDDREYEIEALIDRVADRPNIADMASLWRSHVRSRVDVRDKRQASLARSTAQIGLPGEFAPPEGEFALGGGRRIAKADAANDHWITRIQLEAENISAAQASHAATIAEYAAYAPYLAQGGMTTGTAYEQYQQERPHDQAAD